MFRVSGIPLQLLPNAADVDVHGTDVAAVVVTPDDVQQIFPGIDPIGISDQQLHQVKFLGGEIHRHAFFIGVAALRIQSDGAPGDAGFRLALAAAPENGPDPGLQLQNVKGLGEIVVGAVIEAQQLVHVLGFGGEHDDGHVGELADPSAGLQAIHHRHHHIQNDELHLRILGQAHCVDPIGAGDHLVTFVFQVVADPLDQQLLIVNNQYFHCCPPHRSSPAVC